MRVSDVAESFGGADMRSFAMAPVVASFVSETSSTD